MKITIIPEDKIVYIDSVSFSPLDFISPSNVHALQWKDSQGWIEFVDSIDGTKDANQLITELPSWSNDAIKQWNLAKNNYEAEIARLAEEAKLNKEEPTVI